MIFSYLRTGSLQVNCYILGCEKTKEAVVIDPGGNVEDIKEIIDNYNLKVKYILITHGHFDHTGGLKKLKELTGGLICIHKEDEFLLKDGVAHGMMFGIYIDNPPPADKFIAHGEYLEFGQYKIKVIHTPGHSPGSVSYHIEDKVFTGDILFADSIGRTDLPGGDYELLINTVKMQLFNLPDVTSVYPGHGPSTTIGEEIKFNPFFN